MGRDVFSFIKYGNKKVILVIFLYIYIKRLGVKSK